MLKIYYTRFPVFGLVTDLLRTCYGETDVMDSGLNGACLQIFYQTQLTTSDKGALCVACRESVVLQETSRRHWTSRQSTQNAQWQDHEKTSAWLTNTEQPQNSNGSFTLASKSTKDAVDGDVLSNSTPIWTKIKTTVQSCAGKKLGFWPWAGENKKIRQTKNILKNFILIHSMTAAVDVQ